MRLTLTDIDQSQDFLTKLSQVLNDAQQHYETTKGIAGKSEARIALFAAAKGTDVYEDSLSIVLSRAKTGRIPLSEKNFNLIVAGLTASGSPFRGSVGSAALQDLQAQFSEYRRVAKSRNGRGNPNWGPSTMSRGDTARHFRALLRTDKVTTVELVNDLACFVRFVDATIGLPAVQNQHAVAHRNALCICEYLRLFAHADRHLRVLAETRLLELRGEAARLGAWVTQRVGHERLYRYFMQVLADCLRSDSCHLFEAYNTLTGHGDRMAGRTLDPTFVSNGHGRAFEIVSTKRDAKGLAEVRDRSGVVLPNYATELVRRGATLDGHDDVSGQTVGDILKRGADALGSDYYSPTGYVLDAVTKVHAHLNAKRTDRAVRDLNGLEHRILDPAFSDDLAKGSYYFVRGLVERAQGLPFLQSLVQSRDKFLDFGAVALARRPQLEIAKAGG